MEIACPACRKMNDGFECQRCGSDLTALIQIAQVAEREVSAGTEALRRGAFGAAREHALRAWGLRRSAIAARIMFLAHLGERRFTEATVWYRRAMA